MEETRILRSFGVLYRTFVQYMTNEVAIQDVSFSDSMFLVTIGEKEGISQEEISSLLAIDKAAVARSVKNLVANGYARVEKFEGNKKTKRLFLTDEGRSLYASILKSQHGWLDAMLKDLQKSQRESFIGNLEIMSQYAKEFKKAGN